MHGRKSVVIHILQGNTLAFNRKTSEKTDKVRNVYTKCGPGCSVSIVTDYGLDGPGSNLGGDQIFRLSRPALGPTQPPVKWLQGLSRG